DRAHDLAGSAEAALKRVFGDECRLHRVEGVAFGEALDRRDLRALDGDGEEQTRGDAPTVDEHRAGAALSLVATFLRAGQAHALAEGVEERRADVDAHLSRSAVHVEGDLDLAGGQGGPGRRAGARDGGGRLLFAGVEERESERADEAGDDEVAAGDER